MPELEHICSSTTDALAQAAFAELGCKDYGVVVMRGASSWGTHKTGQLTLPTNQGPLTLRVAYDEREAPYVVGDDGREDPQYLLSLADEGELVVCAWAHVDSRSPLLGVGVDLASTEDFDKRPSQQGFIRLLFGEREHELVREGWPDAPDVGYATAFGAKEAAFKATARPLRRWYESHDEELEFEVRHFGLVKTHEARGERRNAAAQRAMDKMGIGRIQVSYVPLQDAALVVACALA